MRAHSEGIAQHGVKPGIIFTKISELESRKNAIQNHNILQNVSRKPVHCGGYDYSCDH